jgi:hypothetical protein
MLAAWEKDADFDYRFVICLALLMRVGTTIEDEVEGNKQKDFSPWWKKAVDGQAFFTYLTKARHAELKRSDAQTVARPTGGTVVVSRGGTMLISRRRPGGTGSGQQSSVSPLIQDVIRTAGPSRATVAPQMTRSFVDAPYADRDPRPIINDYLDWLEQTLLPGAEARTQPNASRLRV